MIIIIIVFKTSIQLGNALQQNPNIRLHLSPLFSLSELLDMPLKSITAAWESGDLRGSGFTAKEV